MLWLCYAICVRASPAIPGLGFLCVKYPGIVGGPVWTESVLVCCSSAVRVYLLGSNKQEGESWFQKWHIGQETLSFTDFLSFYWERKCTPSASESESIFWLVNMSNRISDPEERETTALTTHYKIYFSFFVCVLHALPRLCPTSETAPLKSGCLFLKRVCRLSISEATVSTIVWQ